MSGAGDKSDVMKPRKSFRPAKLGAHAPDAARVENIPSPSPLSGRATEQENSIMTSEDLFDEILARLWQVRAEVGDPVFRTAAGTALVAIGRVVLDEAETRSKRVGPGAQLVRFPLSRVIRSMASSDES